MDLQGVKFYNYKYSIDKVTLSGGNLNEPYEVNTKLITGFRIEKDYEDNILPYFEITVTISNAISRILLKNISNIKANIIMKCAKFDSTIMDMNSNDTPRYTGFINGVFKVFLDETTPTLSENTIKGYEEQQGLSNINDMDNQNMTMLRLVLYREDYYKGIRKVVNAVLRNTNIPTAVAYILNESNMGNILFTQPDNKTVPDELILLPITTLEQLEYLAGQFAMHKNGTLLFFDLDRGYIIDKQAACTAYETNEYTKTYLMSFNSSDASTNFVKTGNTKFDKEKSNICLISKDSIVSNTKSEFLSETVGSSFIYVDTETGKQTNIGSGNISGLVYTKQNSTNTYTALERKIKEAKKIVNVYIENADITFFTPNKEFIISTDEYASNINGSYRITKCITSFVKDGDTFVARSLLELRGF